MLYEGDMTGVDYFLVDQGGDTALDCARKMHEKQPNDLSRKRIFKFLTAQFNVWQQRIRSLLHRTLSGLMESNVAEMVMQYIDGSGRAFGATAEVRNS